MPGKMDYFVYTSDDGNQYSVKIREYFQSVQNEAADAGALGFGAQDLTKPLMPPGMVMRKVRVQDPTGGSTRSVPCGSVTCDAWDGTDTTLKVDYSGTAGTATFNIVGRTPERPARKAHAVFNLSDAS